ncbi:MAG: class I SAM-dependent methyltransferase [Anaerolineae bacterium]|nr:class I SAM-dependent methyltransferase [Anaerolineae bacterium]
MHREVIATLTTVNQKFYDAFARAFVRSRGRSEPGLERVIVQVEPKDRFLDLGCGQGRVAILLPTTCTYVGIDYSEEMLAQARQLVTATTEHANATFVIGDLLNPQWHTKAEWHKAKFDWILLRAVLHHIPGWENRLRILEQATQILAPGGRIVMANWQFLEIERLRRRLLPWNTLSLTEKDVEPGDYLLDWQREGQGVRYVHLVDEFETLELAQAARLDLESLYRADGHQNNLTLYAVLSKS